MAGDSVGSSYVSATSPNVAATGSVDNQAVYSSQAPSQGSLGMLQPVSATTGSTGQIYYNGDYLAWQSFTSTFPANLPGLWIAGYNGWSWYVTMPLGTWAQELLYVPKASSISMYDSILMAISQIQFRILPARILHHLVLCGYNR